MDILRQRIIELVLVRNQHVLVILRLLVGKDFPAAFFFKIFEFQFQAASVFVYTRVVVGMHQKVPFRQSHR